MKKKGRDPERQAARDVKVLERFIYWTEEQRLRSDDAIKLLSQEFFLSEYTVQQVITKAYNKGGRRVQVVFHQPKPPKLTPEQKELLKKT